MTDSHFKSQHKPRAFDRMCNALDLFCGAGIVLGGVPRVVYLAAEGIGASANTAFGCSLYAGVSTTCFLWFAGATMKKTPDIN